MTEDELLSAIIGPGCNNLCSLYGWRSAHFRPAISFKDGKPTFRTPVQGDGAGWPDLVLTRNNRIIFRELKSEQERLSPAQAAWFEALREAGQDVAIWRPSQWELIVKAMQR